MKVGILTHHWLANCGANLQALSTVQTLRRLGHDPVIIDYRIPDIAEMYQRSTSDLQREAHERFVSEFLPVSRICDSQAGVAEAARAERCEALLSGSDAVLRLDKRRAEREDMRFPNPFWLHWAKESGIARTGFLAASSMGSNFLEQGGDVRAGVKDAVEALSWCSVRDKWTELMLRSCGVPSASIHYCPDPVSVLGKGTVLDLLPQIEVPEKPFILLGFYQRTASPEWLGALSRLARDRGYLTVGFPQPDSPSNGPFDTNIPLPLGPLEWLAWLSRCEGYIGVRFHPIMIAQSLGKSFVAIDHYDLGVPFQNRFLKRVGRKLAPLTRQVSKTYDLCRRIKLEEYVVPSRKLKGYAPEVVLDLLLKQEGTQPARGYREERAEQFERTLGMILGEQAGGE